MIKRSFFILMLTLFALSVPRMAWAAQQADSRRVFDGAELFTDSDTAAFEEEIAGLRDTMKMDVVLVTTAEAGGKSAQQYADDYYDEGGFGARSELSGVLFLIDMDNREVYISTSGTMIRFLTDGRTDQMLGHAYSYVTKGDYAGAARQFLEDTLVYYHEGIPGGQYNYDTETGQVSVHRSIRWYEALLALAAAGFCGGGACLSVRREYAMKQERGRAAGFHMAYRANARFAFHNQNEVLISSFVTQNVLPRNSRGGSGGKAGGFGGGAGRSSTHTSAGGRTHGGRGRKF